MFAGDSQPLPLRDVANLQAEGNVLLDSHPGKYSILLKYDATVGTRSRHRPIHNPDLAELRFEQPRDDIEKCCLAVAGTSSQASPGRND